MGSERLDRFTNIYWRTADKWLRVHKDRFRVTINHFFPLSSLTGLRPASNSGYNANSGDPPPSNNEKSVLMTVIEVVKTILLTTPSVTEGDALLLLNGVRGRGLAQYGPKLKYWLESSPNVFPEVVKIDDIDGVNDHGVDIILEGISSRLRIGFQIKSDGDLKAKDFTIRLKGQITDSRKYALDLLVIVFACRPTLDNRQKYAYCQAEFAGYDEIQIIDPMRAAGLLRALDSPIPSLRPDLKTWQDLFVSSNQLDVAPMYLDDWWGLKPDERFEPPKEFNSILEAVNDCPLTILSGPPAVGKTFAALQTLWRKFGEGREISWIGPARLRPPQGLISDSDTMPDLRERIDVIRRRLGPMNQPLRDAHDFISTQLDLNKLVYIEDPFGKTGQEFAYSLHTYDFFDLNRFVSSISKGTPRYGCHILITTREGLFDRWIDDCKHSGTHLPEFKLIRIGASSYTYKQNRALVRVLAAARCVPDPDMVAALLAPHIRVPLDVERIMRELPKEVTYELIIERANAFNGDFQEMLNKRILADDDAERLFLLLLTTLSTGGSSRNDFYACYKSMYRALRIPGDSDASLTQAMERYRTIFSRLDHRVPNLVGKMLSMTERGFHLEPIHSTIAERIRDDLRAAASDWLSLVASSLPKVKSDFWMSYNLREIAMELLEWGIAKSGDHAEKGIIDVLLKREGITTAEIPRLISSWPSLSERAKRWALGYLREQGDLVIEQFCGSLEYSDISSQDAWAFLRLLIPKPQIGTRKFNVFGNPWGYLSRHLNEVPPDLSESLDKRACGDPVSFTYALSDVLVNCWEAAPPLWREAFLSLESLSDSDLQEKTLFSIARCWKNASDELRVLLDQQSTHDDYRIRAAASIAALVHYDSSPESLQPIFESSLQDSNILVPLLVMREGLGIDEHDRKFAQALFERADPTAAAFMLDVFMHNHDWENVSWKVELAHLCIAKGEQFAQAVLLCSHQTNDRAQAEYLRYVPPTSPLEESEPVRLAWLWVYANQGDSKRGLTVDQVITLLDGLTYPYRQLALLNLSVQANYLAKQLQRYLKALETRTDEDAVAIQEGKRGRQPAEGRKTYSFPIRQLIPHT